MRKTPFRRPVFIFYKNRLIKGYGLVEPFWEYIFNILTPEFFLIENSLLLPSNVVHMVSES